MMMAQQAPFNGMGQQASHSTLRNRATLGL